MLLKITYIWHDCFVVETESCTLVFDYWKDPTDDNSNPTPRIFSVIKPDKPLYVFVSHHHKDHFNRDVFKWGAYHDNVQFFISKDTARSVRYLLRPGSLYTGARPDPDAVHVMEPGDHLEVGLQQVYAFGSTDTGNSWLVCAGGRKIFHAGDLNAWVWKDESTEAEVRAAICDFRSKLAPMRAMTDGVDVAMFPVDSRIGRDYWEGAKIFVQTFRTERFFPMHFGLGADEAQQRQFEQDAVAFDAYANPKYGEYIALLQPYSSYLDFGWKK